MKNATQLKAIVKNISMKKKISAQLVLQNYMLERLLERIFLSKYKDNFILNWYIVFLQQGEKYYISIEDS